MRQGGPGAATPKNQKWQRLRYKLSKESAAKTLSFLFQDNFSGRAEIGLTGDDDLHFKTSPDGAAWVDALTLDKSSGAAKLNSALYLTGDLSPAQITADQNDYSPAGLDAAAMLRLSSDAQRNITGLAGGGEGRVLGIVNAGSNPVVLKDASASSSAANRFSFGSDLSLNPKQSALLWYDATDSRWKALAPPLPRRELLTANRTYYVRTDGSDSNSGLANTAAGAFLTIQKAIDTACALDLGICTVTINVADGTYTGPVALKSYAGVGPISIVGNTTTPANVLLSVTSADVVSGTGVRGAYGISGLKLQANTAGFNAIRISGGTQLNYGQIDFGSANQHVCATGGAAATATGNSTISAGANIHWYVDTHGRITDAGHTITLSGSPAFSQGFAYALQLGVIVCNTNTFSGTATGTRFFASALALIDTVGGGASYLPGNAAGSTANGAQYL